LETPLQGKNDSRTSLPPQEAMDKSLKVGVEGEGEKEHKILCLK